MSLKETNAQLMKHARSLVYVFAAALAVITWFLHVRDWQPTSETANAFGYIAFSFLSLSLVVTPIRVIWPAFGLNPAFFMARRALGICGFLFAVLHYIAIVMVNFRGNFALSIVAALKSSTGLLFGMLALPILLLLFITANDASVRRLGRKWFTLHKLAYLAYPLIIAHAYILGIDFENRLINAYSGSFLMIALVTILLEIIRVSISIKKRFWKVSENI